MNNQSNNGPLYRREVLGVPGGSTWIVGLILIVLGGAFLMQNMWAFKTPSPIGGHCSF